MFFVFRRKKEHPPIVAAISAAIADAEYQTIQLSRSMDWNDKVNIVGAWEDSMC